MFFSDLQLGSKQSLMPSGALLVRDVPLARTGVQHYGSAELPGLDAQLDDDGMILHAPSPPYKLFQPNQ